MKTYCTVGMTQVCCFCWFQQLDFTSKLKELAARVSKASEPMLSFKHMFNPKEHQRLKGDCSFVISVQVGVIYSRPGQCPFSVCQVSTRTRYFPSMIYTATASSWKIFAALESKSRLMESSFNGPVNPWGKDKSWALDWIHLSGVGKLSFQPVNEWGGKKGTRLKRGNQINTRYEGKNVCPLIILLMIKERKSYIKASGRGYSLC